MVQCVAFGCNNKIGSEKRRGGGEMKDGYIIREDMKEYRMTGDMTENQRVWHMMDKGRPINTHGYLL